MDRNKLVEIMEKTRAKMMSYKFGTKQYYLWADKHSKAEADLCNFDFWSIK